MTSLNSDRNVYSLGDDNDTTCEAGHLIIQIVAKQLSTDSANPQYAVVHIKQMNMESCTNEIIVGYKRNVTNELEEAENSVQVTKCKQLGNDSADGLCRFACRCKETCTLYVIKKGLDGSSHSKLCDVALS